MITGQPAAAAGLDQAAIRARVQAGQVNGTICGPWPAEKHLAAPVITVRMIPSDPANSCRNLSILVKGTS